MRPDQPLLIVRDLVVKFGDLVAVDGVSFNLHHGECLGIVGESGSGKTTLGRALLQLIRPQRGQVNFDGQDLTAGWTKRFGRFTWSAALRELRKDMQIIFQDPAASLNPRWTIQESILEPLRAFSLEEGQGFSDRILDLLDMVGLANRTAACYPHQLSGGQVQRVVIARALALRPKLLVADEAVSALDVSIQNEILNLLRDLRREMNLSLIYISHDIETVRAICDRILVMKDGRVLEPQHPYTQALLKAAPSLFATLN